MDIFIFHGAFSQRLGDLFSWGKASKIHSNRSQLLGNLGSVIFFDKQSIFLTDIFEFFRNGNF
jgi:hypothetical protein